MIRAPRKWAAIAAFLAIALPFSALVRFSQSAFGIEGAFSFAEPRHLAFLLLIAAGPALGGLIGWRILGARRASLLGSWPLGSALCAVAPILVMGAIGYGPSQPHLMGALVGLIALLYGIGEEIGWRGFLNDALQSHAFAIRAALITATWWIWHLWFVQQGSDGRLMIAYEPQKLLLDLALLGGASVIFLAIIEESRSLLEIGAFHAAASIAWTMPVIDMAQDRRLLAGLALLAALIALHQLWKRR